RRRARRVHALTARAIPAAPASHLARPEKTERPPDALRVGVAERRGLARVVRDAEEAPRDLAGHSGSAAGVRRAAQVQRGSGRRTRAVPELTDAFQDARWDPGVGVVVLTGAGDRAFCSGGDQKERGSGGYSTGGERPMYFDGLHPAIRHCPKPVIAMVNGFAIGGGHVLHVLCDLSIASENAIFGQTG